MPYISLLRQQTNSIDLCECVFNITNQAHHTQINDERSQPCPFLKDHDFKPVIKRY